MLRSYPRIARNDVSIVSYASSVSWKSLMPLTGHADGGEQGGSSAVCACRVRCYAPFRDDTPFLVPGKFFTRLRRRPTGRNWSPVYRILPSDSGACETVCALVLGARCGKFGPGSPAAPSLVTGIVLIPFGRVLQSSPLPHPLPPFHCPILEAAMAPRKRKKSDALPPQL